MKKHIYLILLFAVSLLMPIGAIAQVATVPYSTGFEDGDDTSWTFVNGTQTNHWMIGSGTSCGGTQSMYITNDGSSNSYTISSASSTVYAYKTFTFSATQYTVSFDWKCKGESKYDLMRVFLVPAGTTLTAGTPASGYAYSTSLPAGYIAIDGGKINLNENWQNKVCVLDITSAGDYMLVFFWGNDGSGGDNPPAAIDNIVINEIACPAPTLLKKTANTTESLTLSWTARGEESSWEVKVGNNASVVTDTPYTVTGLNPATLYDVRVRAICGAGDTSLTLSGAFRTACGDYVDLPWEENFDSYAAYDVPPCWNIVQSYISGSYTYPYVSTSNNKSLYMCATPSRYNMISTPLINAEANSLHILINLKGESYSKFYIGLMTDITDVNTFTVIDSIVSPSTTLTEYEYFADGVNITDSVYIAFKLVSTSTSSSSKAAYIDWVKVNRVSDCRRPLSGGIVGKNYQGATLKWVPYNNYEGSYEVRVSRFNNLENDSLTYYFDDITDTFYVVSDLTPDKTYYNWVRKSCGSDTTDWLYLGSFTTDKTCYPITGLSITDQSYTAVALSWEYANAGRGYQTTGVVIRYWDNDTAADTDTIEINVTGTDTIIGGLLPGHNYHYTVRTLCDPDTATAVSGNLQTQTCGSILGTSTVGVVPFNGSYNYGYSQTIYPSSIVAGIDTITGVKYRVATASTKLRKVSVYMGYTDMTTLSGSNYVANSTLTMVADSVTINVSTTGWVEIPFSTPFINNGTGNIVIAVCNMTGGWQTLVWGAHSSINGNAVYWYRDSAPYDLGALGTASGTTAIVPDITFVGNCNINCYTPMARINGVTTESIDLTWIAGNDETSWIVQYKTIADSVWTDAGETTDMTYTINDLTSGTDYIVRVGSLCSEDTMFATTLTALTHLMPWDGELPYTTGFEEGDDVDWSLFNGIANKWYIDTAVHHTGQKALYISNDSGHTNAYSHMSNVSYAARAFNIADSGKYTLSFDWKASGENTWDYIRVFLVPNGTRLPDNALLAGLSATSVPSYAVAADGGSKLNLSSTWQTSAANFVISNPGAYMLVFCWRNDGSGGTNPPAAIDNVTLDVLHCDAPVNLTLDNNGTNFLMFHWTPTGSEQNWVVKVGDNEPEIVSDTFYTATNLEMKTFYNVKVRALCSDEDTSFALSGTFSTTQNPASLPYATGFESEDDIDWIIANGINGWHIGGAVSNGGTQSLFISSDSGAHNMYDKTKTTWSYAMRQFMVEDSAQYIVSFDWSAYGENSYDYIRAFIVRGAKVFAPNEVISGLTPTVLPAGYISLDGGSKLNLDSAWKHRDAIFNISNPGYYTLVFLWKNDVSGGLNPPAAIDNVAFKAMTCPAPKNLVIDSTTATTAAFHWTAGGEESNWEVKVGDNDPDIVTATNYFIDDLNQATDYPIVIRAVCAAGDTSLALHGLAHTTQEAVTTLPYSTGFEIGDDVAWERKNGANGWFIGNTVACSGNRSLFVSDDNGVTNHFSSSEAKSFVYRKITISDSGEYVISFDYKLYGGSSNYLRVFLAPGTTQFSPNYAMGITSSSLPAGFIALDGGYISSDNTWKNKISIVNVPAAGTYALVFYWCNSSSYNNPPAAVDNIWFGPYTCPVPTALVVDSVSTTSISFSWTAGGEESSWEVKVGDNPAVVVTNNHYTATGLAEDSVYHVVVRAICGIGDTSFALSGNIATTQVPITTLPYSTGFEDGQDVNWKMLNGTNAWYIGSATNNGGAKSMYVSNDGGATNAYNKTKITSSYAVRLFNLAEVGDYAISFDWKCKGETSSTGAYKYDFIRAFVVPSTTSFVADVTNSITSSNLPAGYIPIDGGTCLNDTTNWITHNDTFNIAQTGNYYVVFYWRNDGSSGSDPAGAIDNVSISSVVTVIPDTCDIPVNITATNITDNSATITWTVVGDETQWDILLNNQTIPVSTRPYTLSGLTKNTSYTVRVRAVCGEGDVSLWSVPVTFKTTNVGIDDVNEGSFGMYPNPATNVVILDLSGLDMNDATVAMIDLNGRVVYSGKADVKTTIDLTGYARGTYFVRLTTTEGIAVRKLIVQ